MSIDFIGGGLGHIGTLNRQNLQDSQKVSRAKGEDFSVALNAPQSTVQGDSVDGCERSQKIASLKEQIRSGNYRVESRAVADKLLDTVFHAGTALLEE